MHTPPRGAAKSTIMSAARALIHPTRGSLSPSGVVPRLVPRRPTVARALPARRLLHPRRRGHLVRRAPNLRRRGGLDPPRVRRATLARAVPRGCHRRDRRRLRGHHRRGALDTRGRHPARPSRPDHRRSSTRRRRRRGPRARARGPPDPPRRRRSNPTRPRIRSLSHPPAFLRRGRRQRRRRRPRERRRRGDGSRRRARRRRSIRSVRGAKLRVSTGGGALVASNLTADAVIRTDGGALDVGKLVGRRLRVRTLGGDARSRRSSRTDSTSPPRGERAVENPPRQQIRSRSNVRGILHRAERGGGRRGTNDGGLGGGDVEIDVGERLGALVVRTRGGDARVAVPEGFAPKLVVHGRVGGEEVRGKRIRRATSTDATSVGHGRSLRVVGGSEDEAARKVAAAAATSVVVVDARVDPRETKTTNRSTKTTSGATRGTTRGTTKTRSKTRSTKRWIRWRRSVSTREKAATGRLNWTSSRGSRRSVWGFGGGRRRGMARSGAEARRARRRGGRSRATRSWW